MSSSGEAPAPSRSTMIAFTASPHCSSGTPTTATSSTAGWVESTFSISTEYTFSPPVMIMSFLRRERELGGDRERALDPSRSARSREHVLDLHRVHVLGGDRER